MTTVNQTQLAQALGIKQPTVAQAVKAGRLTYTDPDKKVFDLDDALAQWEAVGGRSTGSVAPRAAHDVHSLVNDSPMTLAEANRREREAKARLLEAELAVKKGELVEIGRIESAWGKALSGLREALLSIPDRIAPLVRAARTDAEAHELVKGEIVKALQNVSEVTH